MKKKILFSNIMSDIYGGGIPFSAVLNGKKTKRISKRTRKRRTRKKPKTGSKTMKKCQCKINKNIDSPEGLGFCPKCQSPNVIMRGKDDNLWKIEQNKWVLIK